MSLPQNPAETSVRSGKAAPPSRSPLLSLHLVPTSHRVSRCEKAGTRRSSKSEGDRASSVVHIEQSTHGSLWHSSSSDEGQILPSLPTPAKRVSSITSPARVVALNQWGRERLDSSAPRTELRAGNLPGLDPEVLKARRPAGSLMLCASRVRHSTARFVRTVPRSASVHAPVRQ